MEFGDPDVAPRHSLPCPCPVAAIAPRCRDHNERRCGPNDLQSQAGLAVFAVLDPIAHLGLSEQAVGITRGRNFGERRKGRGGLHEREPEVVGVQLFGTQAVLFSFRSIPNRRVERGQVHQNRFQIRVIVGERRLVGFERFGKRLLCLVVEPRGGVQRSQRGLKRRQIERDFVVRHEPASFRPDAEAISQESFGPAHVAQADERLGQGQLNRCQFVCGGPHALAQDRQRPLQSFDGCRGVTASQ